MGYKQKYNSVAPMTTSNKAAKLGHTSSAIGMQTDDGVVVTGDASKIGGQTTMTEAEKKRAEYKRKVEERKIRLANEKMERELEVETAKAELAKRRIAREQEKRKREGKDYIDPKTGEVVRRGNSPAKQLDPKAGARLATAEEKAEMRKKKAGFNFFPPSNPKEKSSFKKPILDPKSPGYDVARPLYDSNKDGDTVFSDLNQDGTMLGRAFKKLFK